MNICLINPPSPFLTNERVFPPLGIVRLATYLQQQNYNVKILDMLSTFTCSDLSKYLIYNQIDVVGFTAVSPQIPSVITFGTHIRENHSNIKMILGGPHITMAWNSLKVSERIKDSTNALYNLFDCLVIGYGEYAIIEALKFNRTIINAEDVEDIKNITVTNENYEKLPIPNRDLIDINSYNYLIENKKSTSLIGQLGCPFKCHFCGGRNSLTYNKSLIRSPTSIVNEVNYLVEKYNYQGFMHYDDEINLNKHTFKKLLLQLIEYQNKKGIQLYFRGFSRSDLIDEEEVKLMYEAGFRWLLFGFESGSNRILKNMNKLTTIDKNTKAMEIAKNNNMKVKALMSIGHPGESFETIHETQQWLKQNKPDETDISILTLYPGTEYFDKSHRVSPNKWEYTAKNGDKLYSKDINFLTEKTYYKSKEHANSCYVSTDYLTSRQILDCHDYLCKD